MNGLKNVSLIFVNNEAIEDHLVNYVMCGLYVVHYLPTNPYQTLHRVRTNRSEKGELTYNVDKVAIQSFNKIVDKL